MDGKFKKLIGDVTASKDLLMLLIIGGLYALAMALSNTFVNIYLWKQSGEVMDLAKYQLAIVLTQPLAFLLAGWCAKHVDRVIVLRAGVFVLTSFYFAVLSAGEKASVYLLLLGALLGLGFGLYWLAFNVLTFEITEPENRDFFNGFLGLLSSFAGMIGPISAGALITWFPDMNGYRFVFGLSLFLFASAVILSFRLKRREDGGTLEIITVWKRKYTDKNWQRILQAHFLQGWREGIFVFVIILWVYVSTNSELALGTYGLVTSGVSFVAYFAAGRFIKHSFRKKSILIGGVILFMSVFIIISSPTFTKLIIYGILISLAYPLLLVPYVSLTYDVIGRAWNAGSKRVEYLVTREFYLNAGRISSIVIFLLAANQWGTETAIPWLLIIAGSGHALIYFFIKDISLEPKKEKVKHPEDSEEGGGQTFV